MAAGSAPRESSQLGMQAASTAPPEPAGAPPCSPLTQCPQPTGRHHLDCVPAEPCQEQPRLLVVRGLCLADKNAGGAHCRAGSQHCCPPSAWATPQTPRSPSRPHSPPWAAYLGSPGQLTQIGGRVFWSYWHSFPLSCLSSRQLFHCSSLAWQPRGAEPTLP